MNNKRVFLAMLLLALISAMTEADETYSDHWGNYAADDFAGGRGTGDSPYLIDSAERLARLASLVNGGISDADGVKYGGKSYALIEDIDLGLHEWTPIGHYNASDDIRTFNGTFNGNGHIISSMKIFYYPHVSRGTKGLFGTVGDEQDQDADTRIENVRLANSEVNGGMTSGGLIGFLKKGRVENCIVDVSVTGHGYGDAGGLVSYNIEGEVINCVSKGSVSSIGGSASDIGGLIGKNERGKIINCASRSRIISKTQFSAVGGLVGRNGSEGAILNCVSTGDIEAFKNCTAKNLVGRNEGILENSVGKGKIEFSN